jgi:capsular exopolysaccharide synthesis family protein
VPPTFSRLPTPAVLLVALRRCWLLALVLGLAAAGAAVYLLQDLVPAAPYTVAAMVHIAAAPDALLGPPAPDSESRFVYLQKTQMTLVKSQLVLDAALNDPGVASLDVVRKQANPKEWLSQGLLVDFTKGPEILQISMKGDNPAALKMVVNAVMKAYLDEFINTEAREREEHLKRLTEQLTELKARLTQRERQRLEGLLGDQQTRAKALAKGVLPPPLERELKKEIKDDPLVQKLTLQVERLQTEVNDIKDRAANEDAADKLLRERGTLARLDKAQATLKQYTRKLESEIREQLKQQETAVLQGEIAQTEERLAKIVTKPAGQEALEMTQLAREEEEEEKKTLSTIMGRLRDLKVEARAAPRAKKLDEAVVSATDGKKKMLLTAGGGVGAFALMVLGVSWWEFRKRKITSADEVTHGFGVDLVGTLPRLPRRLRRPVLTHQFHPTSRWSESIDSYRTLLFRNYRSAVPRVVLVTSAVPGEGKTSLASQLALSIARARCRTLLIDADLRRPAVHRVFGLTLGAGLAEVIRGEATPEAVTRQTLAPGLSLITAGKADLQAIYALAGEEFRNLLALLRSEFDFIVVDACPVLPVADTLHLAPHVDGVLFSFLREVSRVPKSAAALQRLKVLGTPVLGAVINGSDEDVSSPVYYTSSTAEG